MLQQTLADPAPDQRSVPSRCGACADGTAAPFAFSMAFQPIVDVARRTIFAYEALVRGPAGEPAPSVLARVDDTNRYAFDQHCRIRAIELAVRHGLLDGEALLSINFMPKAIYKPETCIRATLAAARRAGLPLERLLFECTEGEQFPDHGHLNAIAAEYRRHGLRMAIDDFGAGFSGLDLLAAFQPDILKIDMALIRDIDIDRVRQAILRGVLAICRDLSIRVVAEGIESAGEAATLRGLGVTLMQGYHFARPLFEGLAEARFG